MGQQASSQRSPRPARAAALPPVSVPEKKIFTLARITEFWTTAHAEREKRPPTLHFCELLASYLEKPIHNLAPILPTSPHRLDEEFTLDKAIALVYHFTNADLTPISPDLDARFASVIALLPSSDVPHDVMEWLRNVPADSYFSLLNRDIISMVRISRPFIGDFSLSSGQVQQR